MSADPQHELCGPGNAFRTSWSGGLTGWFPRFRHLDGTWAPWSRAGL